jgi:zinc and cadmium transporter
MFRAWLLTLASVALVSAIPLAGLSLIHLNRVRVERLLLALISLAVGALLGGAFLHLMPEALERSGASATLFGWFLVGFMSFFLLEKLLSAPGRGDRRGAPRLPPLAALNLSGDALHNLVDGMVVAAAYMADTTVGVTATLAVILHEIPQEIGDMGVLVYSGMPIRRAVLLNLLSALAAVVGAVAALLLGERFQGLVNALLPVAAGAFVYVAASDLIPELRRRTGLGVSLRQVALILLGLGLMAAAAALE